MCNASCDLAREMLALEALDAEADNAALREMLHAALDQLRARHVEHLRLRAQLVSLREELRASRTNDSAAKRRAA